MTEQRVLNLFDSSGSFSRDAIRITTYADDYIFFGAAFTVETVVPIASGNSALDMVLDTTQSDRQVVAIPAAWGTTHGPVIITFGTCTSYTGGTTITPFNRLGTSTNESEFVTKYGITPTGYASTDNKILIGTSATNQNSGGGLLRNDSARVLSNGINYVFRADNQSGEDIQLYINLIWYEY